MKFSRVFRFLPSRGKKGGFPTSSLIDCNTRTFLKSKLLNVLNGLRKQTDFVIVASEKAKGTESEVRNYSQTSMLPVCFHFGRLKWPYLSLKISLSMFLEDQGKKMNSLCQKIRSISHAMLFCWSKKMAKKSKLTNKFFQRQILSLKNC